MGYTFGVPRTAAQNAQIARLASDASSSSSSSSSSSVVNDVWLNYNDFVYAGCWTVGTLPCPYYDAQTAYMQIVRVSLGAGVILLLLAAAFGIYKYRRAQRSRRAYQRKKQVISTVSLLDSMAMPT